MMTFDSITQYQQWSGSVWTSDIDADDQMTHALFGLATEVGEVIDPFKKEWYTPHRGVKIDKEELTKEIGDVLYYLVRVADMNDIRMEDVIATNVNKLENRYGQTQLI